MKKFLPSIIMTGCLVLPGILTSCSTEKGVDMNTITIKKDESSTFNNGRFEGWGTSFCWWANRIGYDDELAQKAAELFYDKDKGIGLNIIRYNIGGGDDPSHNHITRTDSAIPGFLIIDEATGNPVYDWNADHNQRNVLKRAVDVCGQEVVVEAFSNSPPYFMTNSGCSSGAEIAKQDNLKFDQYEAFADYLVEVVSYLKTNDKINITSLAPMNEPATDYWHANSWKQEGCHFDMGKSQSKIIVATDKALQKKGLTDVIVTGTDETSIDTQAFAYRALTTEAKNVIPRIDTHSYQGSDYNRLKTLAQDEGKNLWMSEVDGGDTAGKNAGQMGAALWLAKKIIADMNGLQPSAWITWQVIDNHISKDGYNGNKDSGMPDINNGYWGMAVCNHDTKDIILTKKYYAFGQFSKYIRPGFTIAASSDYSLAAYNKDSDEIVVVVVNDKEADEEVAIDLSQFKSVGKNVKVVRTSGSIENGENLNIIEENVKVSGKSLKTVLKALSITTYIISK